MEYIVCTNQLNNQTLDQQQVDHQLHQQNQLNQLNQTAHMDANSMMRLHAQQQNQTQPQYHNPHHNQLNNTQTANNTGLAEPKADPQTLDAYGAYRSVQQQQQQQHLTNQAIAQDRCVQQLQSTMYPPTYDPQQMHYTQQNAATSQMEQQQKQNVDYNQAYQQMSSPTSRSPTTYTQLNTAASHQTATNAWATNQWTATAGQMDANANGQQPNQVPQQSDMNVMQLQMLQPHDHHHTTYEHDLNMYNSFPE